jgi:hypothetical protein
VDLAVDRASVLFERPQSEQEQYDAREQNRDAKTAQHISQR